MRRSARLLEQVRAEIDARGAAARRLQDEAESAGQIARLSEEQRTAVARLVRAEVADENGRTLRQSLWINLMFFVAGVMASVAIQLLIRPH